MIKLDHATINTVDLLASIAFYERYLGLKPGWRTPVPVGGAWLYPEDGSYPIVHLIVRKERAPRGGMFDHIAFRGRNLNAYLAKLKSTAERYTASLVPETKLVQVQHYDPNGVLIEVNFDDEPLEPEEVREGPLQRVE